VHEKVLRVVPLCSLGKIEAAGDNYRFTLLDQYIAWLSISAAVTLPVSFTKTL
jgi:hypothetical protein